MATYNKFNLVSQYLAEGVINTASDTFKIAMCTAANAPVATNAVLADLTVIATTNVTGDTLTGVTSIQSPAGTEVFDASPTTILASGGPIATFRYVVLYDDTPTSPADPLIAWFDYGSDLPLADTESLVITWNASGIFTIA